MFTKDMYYMLMSEKEEFFKESIFSSDLML